MKSLTIRQMFTEMVACTATVESTAFELVERVTRKCCKAAVTDIYERFKKHPELAGQCVWALTHYPAHTSLTTSDITPDLVGNRCKTMWAGIIVTGRITDVFEDEYTAGVNIDFDKPQQWGDDIYTHSDASARKTDEFGNLRYLVILN